MHTKKLSVDLCAKSINHEGKKEYSGFPGFGEPRKPVVNGKEIDSRAPKDGIEITWKND